MSKSDLHVHSIYSERPSDWFLQRLGAQESYTDPETIYRKAKENGMTYVTITDHNRIDGALLLKKNHPEDTFVSMEATTYFPEDGCKIHILLYDITEEQFLIIQELRKNIYDLRRYIIDENIAYSLAHATYSVNNKLTLDHIEKLILLFDVFEVINGARSKRSNNLWHTVLTGLTPEIINDLKIKHNIDPASDKPGSKVSREAPTTTPIFSFQKPIPKLKQILLKSLLIILKTNLQPRPEEITILGAWLFLYIK